MTKQFCKSFCETRGVVSLVSPPVDRQGRVDSSVGGQRDKDRQEGHRRDTSITVSQRFIKGIEGRRGDRGLQRGHRAVEKTEGSREDRGL